MKLFRQWRWLNLAVFLPFAMLLLANTLVQQYYVDRSRGLTGNAAFVEIQNASTARLLATLEKLSRSLKPSDVVVSDTWNIVLAKIESGYLTGHVVYFPSDDYFEGLSRFEPGTFMESTFGIARLERAATFLSAQRAHNDIKARFYFSHDGDAPIDPFILDRRYAAIFRNQHTAKLLTPTGQQSVFNRWYSDPRTDPEQLQLLPLQKVHDHVVFVSSGYGLSYFARANWSTLYQLESDFMLPGRTMEGVGRYALLQILNPSKRIRLELWLTDTLKGDGRNALPPAVIFGKSTRPVLYRPGASSVPLPLTGRGSARIASPVLEPRQIRGASFYLLDMGVYGSHFPERRDGLMNLYGNNVILDPRLLTCFVRDVSIISDDDYHSVTPPESVSSFPAGLQDKSVFYSGIYEDGWFSEHSWIRLARSNRDSLLRIRGLIPRIHDGSFSTNLTVSVNGRRESQEVLPVGYFHIELPLKHVAAAQVDEVKLDFSRWQRLPRRDGRPVAARIEFVGFDRR